MFGDRICDLTAAKAAVGRCRGMTRKGRRWLWALARAVFIVGFSFVVLYPLLKKYQTKATIFVIGNAMGSQHKMTQEQVYELAASGLVSIQSHTYTHGNLSAMDEPALRQEMELSNAALAAATGQIPYVLCYPEGKYSHLTMDVAKDYYTFALRMDGWTYQTGMDPYQVPRSFVSRRITLPDYLWFVSPSGKVS